jgi:hypothetical protein
MPSGSETVASSKQCLLDIARMLAIGGWICPYQFLSNVFHQIPQIEPNNLDAKSADYIEVPILI